MSFFGGVEIGKKGNGDDFLGYAVAVLFCFLGAEVLGFLGGPLLLSPIVMAIGGKWENGVPLEN